jgi:hypothetical protein
VTRKIKFPCLDLHGECHDRADHLIEKFITDNFDELPIKIITGKSEHFIRKTKEYVEKYDLFCYKENYTNYGCWVILERPWPKKNP